VTNADRVAEWLASKDITHAFGIIGGGNVAFWNAVVARGKTQIVCCHHEQAAAQASTFYFRTCGKIAPCIVTTGAGSTNAITGVMSAWMDSMPLLVISGNEAYQYHGDGGRGFGFQGYSSHHIARRFTKRAAFLTPSRLDEDLAAALEPRQGPVWLDFPKDNQNALA